VNSTVCVSVLTGHNREKRQATATSTCEELKLGGNVHLVVTTDSSKCSQLEQRTPQRICTRDRVGATSGRTGDLSSIQRGIRGSPGAQRQSGTGNSGHHYSFGLVHCLMYCCVLLINSADLNVQSSLFSRWCMISYNLEISFWGTTLWAIKNETRLFLW